MRTTLDIDRSVLDELKRRQRREGGTLGELASRLLARALAEGEDGGGRPGPLRWASAPMGARVDLDDAEAVTRVLDGER